MRAWLYRYLHVCFTGFDNGQEIGTDYDFIHRKIASWGLSGYGPIRGQVRPNLSGMRIYKPESGVAFGADASRR